MDLTLEAVSADSCLRTVQHLDGLGIRLAGTPGEKAAADWIEQRYRELGLSQVHQQEFPCLSFGHKKCRFSFQLGGRWSDTEVEPAAHSPSSSGTIEAPLVFLEQVPENAKAAARMVAGRAVLTYGSVFFKLGALRRIMDARPAFILLVDERFPSDWTVAVGFPRYWVEFLRCPVVNISYATAWQLIRNRIERVRLQLDAFTRSSTSQNIIGEIAGGAAKEEIVVVSAHHDSVINNPGADDNCTGVAAVLELARLFAGSKPARTLRFIAFGTEEQLSEGSRHYAFSAPDIEQICFVLNTDSIGAWMGTTGIHCTGAREIGRLVEEINRRTGFPGHVKRDLSPFSDHFPFNLFGIPAVWYYRETCAGGRHYHHSRLETPDVVSAEVLRRTVYQQAVLLQRVANDVPLPFPRRLTQAQQRKLDKMAREWMGPRASAVPPQQ